MSAQGGGESLGRWHGGVDESGHLPGVSVPQEHQPSLPRRLEFRSLLGKDERSGVLPKHGRLDKYYLSAKSC